MTNYPAIIGLSGVARSGKDTVGGILRDLYGYELMSFSDILNQALVNLNPLVERYLGEDRFFWRYADLVADIGFEEAKEVPEVRRLLQAVGTEVGRNLLGENIWVDAMFNRLPKGKLIAITNVRFPNEYDAVVAHGGVNWRVERPGVSAANNHVSDTALDNHQFDYRVDNDGTIRELADKVMRAMESPLQASFL